MQQYIQTSSEHRGAQYTRKLSTWASVVFDAGCRRLRLSALAIATAWPFDQKPWSTSIEISRPWLALGQLITRCKNLEQSLSAALAATCASAPAPSERGGSHRGLPFTENPSYFVRYKSVKTVRVCEPTSGLWGNTVCTEQNTWMAFMQARVCCCMPSLHTGRALFTSRRVHVKDSTTNSLYGGPHTSGTFTSTLERMLLWATHTHIWVYYGAHFREFGAQVTIIGA